METTLDPVLAAGGAADAARAARGAQPAGSLGREDFMALLIAQLENQDPLEPAKDTEFISQLATFSSLEQLITANANLEGLALGQASLLNSQALTLIGREALVANGDSLEIENGQPTKLMYRLPQAAGDAKLTIYSADGAPLRVFDLSTEPGGWVELAWDGRDSKGNALADGTYRVEVSAAGTGGEQLAVALARGVRIDAVRFGGEAGITLVTGDAELPFDQILEIRAGD
jgi:flagellar basal-body rod modification protein FlgD